jgi:antitoxin component YwqK of YwqJK toxin-antitoxin module
MWDTAMQGLALGGSIGGLYGAGGGFVIGLLTGFFTADAHYTQINNQVRLEQAKTDDVEAKIDKELQRQRELEAKLASAAGSSPAEKAPEPPQPDAKPADTKVTTVTGKQSAGPSASSTPPTALASLNNKKENLSNSPASPFKNVEVRDINGDGVPDLWIYHNPLKPTEIVRQEEASHGDGRVDTWTYFQNGKLVRREVDTKGKGTADTIYYYGNDQIIREDRNDSGTGYVSFRAIYKNGRRAKVEEDTTGAGKMDHWIYYDTNADGDVVLKEERDLNGDGAGDVWTYSENGRLVRRDVSAAGLEILSQQDRLPSSPDSKQPPQLAKDGKGRL